MTISPTIRFHFLKNITLTARLGVKSTLIGLFTKERKPLADLTYVFCSDERLLQINRQFLQHDFYTDIITFPLSQPQEPITAEIYISVDRVRENARKFGVSMKNELLRVILHGSLHLCGYGDKTAPEQAKMRKLEDKYLMFHVKQPISK